MDSPAHGTIARPDVVVEDGMVRMHSTTGRVIEVPIAALRDRCDCAACRHPSGQRLLDPAAIQPDIRPTDIRLDGDALRVLWMPERHESVYSVAALDTSGHPRVVPMLWDANDAGKLPTAQHEDILG